MVDFGDEFHLDWRERVRVWDYDVDFKVSSLVGSALWARKGAKKVEWRVVDE